MRQVILVKSRGYVLTEKLLNLDRLHGLRPIWLSWWATRRSWCRWLVSRAAGITTHAKLLAHSTSCVLLRWVISLILILIVRHVLRLGRIILLELIAACIRRSLVPERGLALILLLVVWLVVSGIWLLIVIVRVHFIGYCKKGSSYLGICRKKWKHNRNTRELRWVDDLGYL